MRQISNYLSGLQQYDGLLPGEVSKDRLIDLIVQVIESLQDISEDNSFGQEDRLKCKGLFSSLLSSRNVKVLLILQMVLGHANRLSSIFQDPKVEYSYALFETKAFGCL